MNIKKKGDSTMINKDVIKDVIEAIKMALENIDVDYCKLSQIDYAKLNVQGSVVENLKEQKYLERPFAYEFYHKLRELMESDEVDFGGPIVQAEVSKTYQKVFENRKTPDFLIHVPNNVPFKKNLAVIEFKLATNLSEIEHDFEKLVDFKTDTRLKYAYGIEVIIGNTEGNTESLKDAKSLIDKLNKQGGEEIIIIDFNTDLKKANDWKIRYTHP